MVKKFGRRLVAIAAAALMVTATAAPAFAGNSSFSFTVRKGFNDQYAFSSQPSSWVTKDDVDPYWYVTPVYNQCVNWPCSSMMTWIYSMQSGRNGTPSGYHNITSTSPYRNLTYKNWKPARGSRLRCEIKEDGWGARGYTIAGNWCP